MTHLEQIVNDVAEIRAMIVRVDERLTRIRDGVNEREAAFVRRLAVQAREFSDFDSIFLTGSNKEELKQFVLASRRGLTEVIKELYNFKEQEMIPFFQAIREGTLTVPQISQLFARTEELHTRLEVVEQHLKQPASE